MKWALIYIYLSGFSSMEPVQKQAHIFNSKEECETVLIEFKKRETPLAFCEVQIREGK